MAASEMKTVTKILKLSQTCIKFTSHKSSFRSYFDFFLTFSDILNLLILSPITYKGFYSGDVCSSLVRLGCKSEPKLWLVLFNSIWNTLLMLIKKRQKSLFRNYAIVWNLLNSIQKNKTKLSLKSQKIILEIVSADTLNVPPNCESWKNLLITTSYNSSTTSFFFNLPEPFQRVSKSSLIRKLLCRSTSNEVGKQKSKMKSQNNSIILTMTDHFNFALIFFFTLTNFNDLANP
ncbi:hypothetical protein BpHYR1_033926 [Brachionus plicatilis]|uniref:Uncharacterized protein n=1 Tax=Brachionus plicatilis TaxID=10195 RepID=A0A3M7SD47_BRAPC|nr:hypothetical protein BpHYR1_033926 [Brachionus plicatilis]